MFVVRASFGVVVPRGREREYCSWNLVATRRVGPPKGSHRARETPEVAAVRGHQGGVRAAWSHRREKRYVVAGARAHDFFLMHTGNASRMRIASLRGTARKSAPPPQLRRHKACPHAATL